MCEPRTRNLHSGRERAPEARRARMGERAWAREQVLAALGKAGDDAWSDYKADGTRYREGRADALEFAYELVRRTLKDTSGV